MSTERLTGAWIDDEACKRVTTNLSWRGASPEQKTLAEAARALLKDGHLYAKAKPETTIDKALAGDAAAMEKFKTTINKSSVLEEYIETHTVPFVRESALKHIRRADFINGQRWYSLLGNRGTFRDRFRLAVLPGLVQAQQDLDKDTRPVAIPGIGPETALSGWLLERARRMKALENRLTALRYEAFVGKCRKPSAEEEAMTKKEGNIYSVFGLAGSAAAIWFLRGWLVGAWRWFSGGLVGNILRFPVCLILLLVLGFVGFFAAGFVAACLIPGNTKKCFAISLGQYRAAMEWSATTDTYKALQALRAELAQQSVPAAMINADSLHYLYYLSRIYGVADVPAAVALAQDMAARPEAYSHQRTKLSYPDKPLDWFVRLLYRSEELRTAIAQYDKDPKRGGFWGYGWKTYPWAINKVAESIFSDPGKPYNQYLGYYIYMCGDCEIHQYSKAAYLDILWDLSLPHDHIRPDVLSASMQSNKIVRYEHTTDCCVEFAPAQPRVREFLLREEQGMDAMCEDEQRDFARCMYLFNWGEDDAGKTKRWHYCREAMALDSPAMLMALVRAYCNDAHYGWDNLKTAYPPDILPADKAAKRMAMQWERADDKELAAYGRNILSYYEEMAHNAELDRAIAARERAIREEISRHQAAVAADASSSSSRSGGVLSVFDMPSVITGPYGHTYVRVSISSGCAEYQRDDKTETVTIYDSDIAVGPLGFNASGGFYW